MTAYDCTNFAYTDTQFQWALFGKPQAPIQAPVQSPCPKLIQKSQIQRGKEEFSNLDFGLSLKSYGPHCKLLEGLSGCTMYMVQIEASSTPECQEAVPSPQEKSINQIPNSSVSPC